MPGNWFKNERIPYVPRSSSDIWIIHRDFFYRLARNKIPVVPQKTVIEKVMQNNLRQKTAGSPEPGLKKLPEQNNRSGIEHYFLIKNNNAAAPIIVKETEPSKLTTKSALTDNSLNTIRSRNSRTCLRFTTNLLVQGLGACPMRIWDFAFFSDLAGVRLRHPR